MVNLKKMKRIAELERQITDLWYEIRKLQKQPPAIVVVSSDGTARVAYDMKETLHAPRLEAPPKKRGRPRKVQHA